MAKSILKRLNEILSSIQMYLRLQCNRNVTLIDKKGCTFRTPNSALNFVMKERAQQGIGVDVNQANLITQEQENYLWEHGFLDSENADTLVWVLGVQFALRAGHEHLRLRNSQLPLQCDELGREFLQYTEDISKANNGGLNHLRIKRKVVRAYKNLTNAERCPVELHLFARFAKAKWGNMVLQRGSRKRNFRKCGKTMMIKAQFDGHYTNHSLRRSCATRSCAE